MTKVWESHVRESEDPEAVVQYRVWVESTEPYKGTLFVYEGSNLIFHEGVSISFDAQFGPDVADVAAWQGLAMEAIEMWEHGEPVLEREMTVQYTSHGDMLDDVWNEMVDLFDSHGMKIEGASDGPYEDDDDGPVA